MAANKAAERFSTFTLAVPAPAVITSGEACTFGDSAGSGHVAACVAIEAQNGATSEPYNSDDGYITFDFEGAYNLTVIAETLGSPSAGAAINVGDSIFYAGGVYDKTTGITYGGVLCKDTTGTFFGLALAALAAGTTGIIPVLLKNAA